MIECTGCHTLNPAAERACLVCGAPLSGPGQTAASPQAAARCPAGHPVNPAWASCPYCDRQQEALAGSPPPGRATRLEGTLSAPASQAPAARPTRLEEPAELSGGRRTVLHEGPAGAPATRLVAALAAPALGPGGMVFPVRSGKNAIGAGRANDVVLTGDPEVSREHAVLLHRDGRFLLTDRQSTNGTRINGCEAPADAPVELHDRDSIRCGATDLVFLVIETSSH